VRSLPLLSFCVIVSSRPVSPPSFLSFFRGVGSVLKDRGDRPPSLFVERVYFFAQSSPGQPVRNFFEFGRSPLTYWSFIYVLRRPFEVALDSSSGKSCRPSYPFCRFSIIVGSAPPLPAKRVARFCDVLSTTTVRPPVKGQSFTYWRMSEYGFPSENAGLETLIEDVLPTTPPIPDRPHKRRGRRRFGFPFPFFFSFVTLRSALSQVRLINFSGLLVFQ